jgi:two-component system, NtrC family, nitrogen regulation response regulator NtrX
VNSENVPKLIGNSKAIVSLTKEIKKISKNRIDVLLIGASGTGKSTVAEEIHRRSSFENDGSLFLSLTPKNIQNIDFSSIFTGYEPGVSGSHNGVLNKKVGGGTIVIEDIENIGFRSQAEIAQFIKKRQLLRDSKSDTADDTRLIITAKDDIKKLSKKNEILQELADELSTFKEVRLAPLRDRLEDIPYLVQYFIKDVSERIGVPKPVLDINALDILMRQQWDGNIRDLRAVIERSVLFSSDGCFKLPAEMTDGTMKITKMLEKIFVGEGKEIHKSLDTIEIGIIKAALRRFDNNISKTAEFLGMSTNTLESRLVHLEIKSRNR